MTGSTVLTVTGQWTATTALPDAASWYGQHDGPVPLDDAGTLLVAGGADAASAPLRKVAVHHPDGSWEPRHDLGSARKLHTVTVLDDGSVLVTGGLNGTAATGPGLPSCERYNPTTKEWSDTGAMSTPRWGHSAVKLDNGSVLVAGGSTLRSGQSMKALRSAELYNPDSGKWTPVDDMTDARTGHTAVPLSGGLVLVCGGTAPVGTSADPAVAFCELYDPQGGWTPTGSLLRARRHHQATRVSANTVLVTGGTAAGATGEGPFDPFAERTAELFDLATGLWTATQDMPSGRAFHRALPFGTGQVLVIGGAASDRDESGYRSAVVLDVARNVWTPVTGLNTGRWSFAAAVLPDLPDDAAHPGPPVHQVLVAGGVARSGLAAADPALSELTRDTEVFAGGPV